MNKEYLKQKNELEKNINKYKNKRKTALKISYKANKKKEKWTRLAFPINNDKFDKTFFSFSIASLCAGLFAGGLIFKSNGQDVVNGMFVGTVVGGSTLPILTSVVGGVRRATQLLADKLFIKYDLKQKELIAREKSLIATEHDNRTNIQQTKTAESNSQEI